MRYRLRVQTILERFEYKKLVAAIFISAVFVQILDVTLINVALPTLAQEFEVTALEIDWTVLSFGLALGVMTAAAGSVGRRLGLRRAFLVAILGFTVASALCGASQSLSQLVAFRAVQGGFAGLITPIGSALLYNAFPVSERAAASRRVITVAVIAPASGPILGGLILEWLSWRWIFFVNVPIGLLGFLGAFLVLRADVPSKEAKIDVRGFLLAALGLGSLLYTISRGGERGWTSPTIVFFAVLALVALGLLAPFERRIDDPLVDFSVFRTRAFRTCNAIALPLFAAFFATVYLLPLLLQDEGSWSALDVGLAMFPQAVGVLIATQLVGRKLYKRVGPRRLIGAGVLLALVVSIWISTIDPSVDPWLLRLMLLLRGFAIGMTFVPLEAAVFAAITSRDLPNATSIYGTSRQIAPAFGVAASSTILAIGLGNAVSAADRIDAYQVALFWTSIPLVLAALVSLTLRDSDAAATMENTAAAKPAVNSAD